MFYFLHLREQATRLKHDVSATTCPHYPMQIKVYIGNEGVKHKFNKFEEQKNKKMK